jgi:hypothetical protein
MGLAGGEGGLSSSQLQGAADALNHLNNRIGTAASLHFTQIRDAANFIQQGNFSAIQQATGILNDIISDDQKITNEMLAAHQVEVDFQNSQAQLRDQLAQTEDRSNRFQGAILAGRSQLEDDQNRIAMDSSLLNDSQNRFDQEQQQLEQSARDFRIQDSVYSAANDVFTEGLKFTLDVVNTVQNGGWTDGQEGLDKAFLRGSDLEQRGFNVLDELNHNES